MFESVGDGVEQSPGESAFRASGFAGLAGGTAPRSDEQGVAELLESLLSGGSIVAQLPALMSIDRSALSDEESLTFLEILERVIASCHAVQAELLVQLAGPSTHATRILLPDAASGNHGGPGPRVTSVIVIEELVREEIASSLRWSVGQTQRRIDAARLLTSTLPGTFASLTSGHISHPHAMVIADAAHRLPGMNAVDGPGREQFARVCALLEHATIPVAHVSTVARTRRVADRVAITADAVDAEERDRRRRQTHDVFVWDEGDGTATLSARMNAEHARACMASINALARDPRLNAPCGASIGHRRSLALATLLINEKVQTARDDLPGARGSTPSAVRRPAGAACATKGSASASRGDSAPGAGELTTVAGQVGTLPGSDAQDLGSDATDELMGPRPRVHLDIVVSLESLMGIADDQAVVSGVGLMPAHLVRGMLADATMRRLVTDPLTGHLLDLGRRRYRISDGLREFIETRDRTCRFPGCSRRATECQIDHAIAWDDGGGTSRRNLGALCTRHHQVKTHGGWHIDATDPNGSCTWRSPLGRVYSRAPEPVLPPVGGEKPVGSPERALTGRAEPDTRADSLNQPLTEPVPDPPPF